jgi:hypothetical protein
MSSLRLITVIKAAALLVGLQHCSWIDNASLHVKEH